jgi:hypothetical protein
VLGDDPNSLFRPDNLGGALDQLADQLPAGEQVSVLRIEPGSLNAQTGGGEGLVDVSELDPSLPALLAAEIHRRRDDVTLADIGSVELVATRDGPEWYVQIDPSRTDASPPWTYGAPLAGRPLTAGGAPPEPARSG